MEGFVEIQWATGSIDEARRVARYLVQERMVACAHIIPWTENITMLNNQLETTQESKCVMRARREMLDEVIQVIEQNTTFDVPEITYQAIEGCNASYAEWLQESAPSGAPS